MIRPGFSILRDKFHCLKRVALNKHVDYFELNPMAILAIILTIFTIYASSANGQITFGPIIGAKTIGLSHDDIPVVGLKTSIEVERDLSLCLEYQTNRSDHPFISQMTTLESATEQPKRKGRTNLIISGLHRPYPVKGLPVILGIHIGYKWTNYKWYRIEGMGLRLTSNSQKSVWTILSLAIGQTWGKIGFSLAGQYGFSVKSWEPPLLGSRHFVQIMLGAHVRYP